MHGYSNPGTFSLEPLLPEPGALDDLVLAAVREAAALEAAVHPRVRESVADLLRSINTYHSNLIEGHDTRPRDIERALAGHYARDPERRALQLEARAHVEVQRFVEARLATQPDLAVTGRDFVCWLHREFYVRLPEEYRFVTSASGGRRTEVLPGALRTEDVGVGAHLPPPPAALPELLDRFAEGYELRHHAGQSAVVAAAASHHRLLWIHPFLDGNGRVARLMTDAMLRRAGIGAHGLWTVSRGLASRRAAYLAALAAADAERWDDYDGRSARSLRALTEFCRFFLKTCLDQIRFMRSLLELDGLARRVGGYADRRAAGVLGTPLPASARYILLEVLRAGEMARGEAARVAGASERTGRRLLSLLLREGLLRPTSAKGPVRLGFPTAAVGYYFPQLYPEAALDEP